MQLVHPGGGKTIIHDRIINTVIIININLLFNDKCIKNLYINFINNIIINRGTIIAKIFIAAIFNATPKYTSCNEPG